MLSQVFYAPKGTLLLCGVIRTCRPPSHCCCVLHSCAPDTPSYTNNNIMASYFPHQLTQTELVLYIRSVDAASVLQPEVDTFSLAFNASCRAIAEPGFVEGVEGYYLFKHMGLPDKALAPFVSPDGKATMIVVTINALVVGKPGTTHTALRTRPLGISPLLLL